MTSARAIGLAVAGSAVAAGAFMYMQSGGPRMPRLDRSRERPLDHQVSIAGR
jgi:hypothetical protein